MASIRLGPSFRLGTIAALLLASPSEAQTKGHIRVERSWTRPTPPAASTAVGYLTIINTGAAPDRLIGGTSPLANRLEIHEMSMAGGVMRMRPVSGGLVVPPRKAVALRPGGYHLMLIGPKRAYKLGERIPVTLRFARAGAIRVELLTVNSQAQAPARADAGSR